MEKVNNRFASIEQVTGQYLSQNRTISTAKQQEVSFQEILIEKQTQSADGLKFSKHASNRLEQRNINLTKEQTRRLLNGVQKAEKKGIRESLVMMDSLAFIVNVPNQTVVTALDQSEAQENVFTNIDGAVII